RLRTRAEIANRVRRTRRDGVRWRRLARRPTEAAIAPAEDRLRHATDQVAGGLFRYGSLEQQQRALARPFVDHLDDARAPDHRILALERALQREALLSIDHHQPVDAGIRIALEHLAVPDNRRHGRQYLEVVFIDEGEFVFVHRILAKPDAQRIEH